MKARRVAITVAVLASLFGCAKQDGAAEQEANNKEIVTKATEAMNNQEYDSLDQFFAEDFQRYSQATPGVEIKSLAEMVGFVREWYTAFPDARMDLKLIAAEGDLVAVWGTFVGTHEASMGPLPATGKRIESETFAFFRLEEGKIVESWVTWDNLAIFDQLGLTPPSAAKPPEEP